MAKRANSSKNKKEGAERDGKSPKRSARKETKAETANSAFPIVGIGASAGGLKALISFFEALPERGRDLAFVVVTHLDPTRESSLADLLRPHTSLQVSQITKRQAIQAGYIYVIPPDKSLVLTDSHLDIADFEQPRGRRMPIDLFFRSLAEVGDRGIGIVLSGGGSDGVLGLRAVKEHGGLVMAQDPDDAEHTAMPRNAIATNLVDFVLPANKLGNKIVEYARNRKRIVLPEKLPHDESDAMYKILAELRSHTGHDFSNYKQSTILRRIARRMQVNQVYSMSDYLRYVRGHHAEMNALMKYLLISVTQFFRDAESWKALEKKVVPKLFDAATPDKPVRVWVPGCATGEEAYGIAMLLQEEAGRRDIPAPEIQVFASDLDEAALAYGRRGIYPEATATDVPEERLRRFFIRENNHYQIKKEVRECVLFTAHGLLKDPPFSRLDLISCRNLLIYLNWDLHENILKIFHYGLLPGGFLFLGSVESADSTMNLFNVIDQKHKIYQREENGAPVSLPNLGYVGHPVPGLTPKETPAKIESIMPHELERHRKILEQHAPPSLIVNRNYELLHLSDNVGRYLQRPGGRAANQILMEVRSELRPELQTALHEAFEHGRASTSPPIKVAFNGDTGLVYIVVRPGEKENMTPTHALVMFIEAEYVQGAEGEKNAAADDAKKQALQDEVKKLRERLQATIEEYESSREEMKAANEELQSINEEYKSTGEELETSKEELQSLNEELETVNHELKSKVDELSQSNGDMQNLMASTAIGTLFLDRALHIKRYTPRITELFNVMPSDVNRLITHLTHKIKYDNLAEDAEEALRDLSTVERQVQHIDGAWFLMRLRPYRTVDDHIEGVVITFVDITAHKLAEEQLSESKKFAESIVQTLHEPLLILRPDLHIRSANDAFYDHFRLRPRDMLGKKIYEIGNGQWDIPELRRLLSEVLLGNHAFNDFEVRHTFKTLGPHTLLLNARRLDDMQLILLGIRDITQLKQNEEKLREANQRKDEFLAILAHELRNPLATISTSAMVLTTNPGVQQMQRSVNLIQRQIKHLSRLVDDLLDVARLSRGKVKLKKERLDLGEQMREALVSERPLIKEKKHEIKLLLPAQPVFIEADPIRVQQILVNILNNAAKYMDDGGKIEFMAKEEGNDVICRCRDTGYGIEAGQLPFLFESFIQIRREQDHKDAGLGVGLAMVKQLVELHGGTVCVSSEGLGKGCEFTIRFPLAPPPEERLSSRRSGRVGTGKMKHRILIVEDNKSFADALEYFLKEDGHKVWVIPSGQDAVAQAKEKNPDIILLDIGLPGEDGYKVAKLIRESGEFNEVVLIAMSGYEQDQEKSEGVFDRYFIKSGDPQELLNVL